MQLDLKIYHNEEDGSYISNKLLESMTRIESKLKELDYTNYRVYTLVCDSNDHEINGERCSSEKTIVFEIPIIESLNVNAYMFVLSDGRIATINESVINDIKEINNAFKPLFESN